MVEEGNVESKLHAFNIISPLTEAYDDKPSSTLNFNSQCNKQCQVSNAVRDGATQLVVVKISAHKYTHAG